MIKQKRYKVFSKRLPFAALHLILSFDRTINLELSFESFIYPKFKRPIFRMSLILQMNPIFGTGKCFCRNFELRRTGKCLSNFYASMN